MSPRTSSSRRLTPSISSLDLSHLTPCLDSPLGRVILDLQSSSPLSCAETNNPSSGPSTSYPKKAYRTPLGDLVSFLDETHGENWAIWEFRAEGTGYPDSDVHDRILHFPWPDHHPPPFRLVPIILASMRNWLAGGELKDGGVTGVPAAKREGEVDGERQGDAPNNQEKTPQKEGELANSAQPAEPQHKEGNPNGRVVVVHCKAGKGRSGTLSSSFLIAERAWPAHDALARFTSRRMRPGFGQGVSIPSQRRWITYVDRWAARGKRYVERRVQVLEVHLWGVRDGVRVEVEGFVDGGRKVRAFHRFSHSERTIVEGPGDAGKAAAAGDSEGEGSASESTTSTRSRAKKAKDKLRSSVLFSHAVSRIATQATAPGLQAPSSASSSLSQLSKDTDDVGPSRAPTPDPGPAIILRPSKEVTLETSDVKISVQRRSKPRQLAPSIITSVAHVWFNAFFEGRGPELETPEESGVFEASWDEMDGLKGFMKLGTRAFERMAVVWRVVGEGEEVRQPGVHEDVGSAVPADWRGEEGVLGGAEAEVDKVAVEGDVDVGVEMEGEERAGLKTSGPAGEDIDGNGAAQEAAEGGSGGDASHGRADNIPQAMQADTQDGGGKGKGNGDGHPKDTM